MNKAALLLILNLAIIVCTSSPALAARVPKTTPKPGGYSLTPTIGVITTSGPESSTVAPVYGIKFGYDQFGSSFVNSLGVEGNLNYFNNGNSNGYLYNLDILYLFQTTKTAIPYFVIGAGAINSRNDTTSDTFPFLNYGVGLKYFLKDTFALRGDVRHILAYESGQVTVHNNFNISLGINYYFGKSVPVKPVETKNQQQLEKEKLEKEQAAKELQEKQQHEQELQKQQEENELKLELEQQEWNKKEKERLHKEWEEFEQQGSRTASPGKKPVEPYQVKPAEVEPEQVMPTKITPVQTAPVQTAPVQAAPVQAAPVQAAPVKAAPVQAAPVQAAPVQAAPVQAAPVQAAPVQAAPVQAAPVQAAPVQAAPVQAAPPPKPIKVEKICMAVDILYETDKSEILPMYYDAIAKVAKFMKDFPKTKGVIEGHTDNIAGEVYNQKLSERRAKGVKMYLVEHFGIDASRLKTKGYGYSKPIADNDTPEGRQKNRRTIANFGCVEIVIYSK